MERWWPDETYACMDGTWQLWSFLLKLECPFKINWLKTINHLHSVVGWLYSRWGQVTLGITISAIAKAIQECLRCKSSGVPLWKLVPLSEGPWEEGISETVRPGWSALSWKNCCGPWVLGSLCCAVLLFVNTNKPFFFLVQHDKSACFPFLFQSFLA